jgi:hypothetical protein
MNWKKCTRTLPLRYAEFMFAINRRLVVYCQYLFMASCGKAVRLQPPLYAHPRRCLQRSNRLWSSIHDLSLYIIFHISRCSGTMLRNCPCSMAIRTLLIVLGDCCQSFNRGGGGIG